MMFGKLQTFLGRQGISYPTRHHSEAVSPSKRDTATKRLAKVTGLTLVSAPLSLEPDMQVLLVSTLEKLQNN